MENKKEFLKWILLVVGITAFVVLMALVAGGNRSGEQTAVSTGQEEGLNEQGDQASLSDFFDDQTGKNAGFSEFSQDDPFAETCAGLGADDSPVFSGFTACGP